MTLLERWRWIVGLWGHYWTARHNHCKQPTRFWSCVRGTVALLLNREKPRILDFEYWYDHRWFDPELHTIWWTNFGSYETDYGTGKSWDYLVVGPWLTFAVGSDGSL